MQKQTGLRFYTKAHFKSPKILILPKHCVFLFVHQLFDFVCFNRNILHQVDRFTGSN